MAYRRGITARAKVLYQQNRFSPSFSYLHHHNNNNNDNDNNNHQCPRDEFRKVPNDFIHRSIIHSFSGSGRGSLFLDPKWTPNGLTFGRFMSTNVGEAAADKIGYVTDVTEVLTDTTVEAAAAAAGAAPLANEVAVAAADSAFPIAALQHLIDGIHTYTGFNWWASIVVTTLLIRSVTVPLLINQLKSTTKLSIMRPHLEEIKQEMQDRGMSPTAVAEGQARMKVLFREYGVTPWTPLKGLLFQGPIFVSFFLAIRNMVEKVPSFKVGGAYWFTDLTTPDSMYIFPVLTALTFWITVECNAQEGLEGNPVAGTMKKVSRVFAALTVPFTMGFPKAIFCYWVTSNLFSLAYGLVIKRTEVKKLLGVPIIPVAPRTTAPKPSLSFLDAMKKYADARRDAQQSTSPPLEASKPTNQRISSSSVINQRLKTLEKEVKGRKKGKKR